MGKKINILHIIESSETGGAESIFFEIIFRLDRLYNNYAGLFYEGWLSEKLKENNITPFLFKTKRSFDILLIVKLIYFIKKFKINLIHSHLFGANVYSSCAGKMCGIPVISTFHGTVDVKKTDRMMKLKYWFVNYFSEKIVYVSENLRDYFITAGLTNHNKSIVIYNGIDLKKFSKKLSNKESIRNELKLEKKDIMVGSIGDLREAKGYHILIDAAHIVIKTIPNLKFIIAGSITDRIKQYRQKIKEYCLEDHIFFIDFRTDIPEILSSLDVFILPSVTEGFSISTVEAMALELPVIVTKSGGPEEIVTNNETGIIVNINSPEEIANALIKIVTDKVFSKKISAKSRMHVEKMFSIDAMIENYVMLYDDLCH